MIVSMRSKMCLTVKEGSDRKGTPIVQDSPINSHSQQWKLVPQGLSLYIIESKVKKGCYLGMYHNSWDEGAQLVLTHKEEYAFWRVIGAIGDVQ